MGAFNPIDVSFNYAIAQYNSFRQGVNSRMRTLTMPSPTTAQPIMVNRSHHFLHSMPETLNTHNGNGHFTNHTYQATKTRGCAHHTTPFRPTNTTHDQYSFYHRGSPKSKSSLYGTFSCEYYKHALHNHNIVTNNMETIPLAQARGTIY